MSEIAVSVLCLAYNHEKYIRHCLDGFVMQKTNFAFEVIIHDDASTDNTAAIIREYQERYPDIIRPIFQTENQYSKKVPITRTILVPAAVGRYFAFCEGDDYWSDPYKLQKQYDALQANPSCHMCVHKVQGITEQGDVAARTYPMEALETGPIEPRTFLSLMGRRHAFHTTSFFVDGDMYRRYIADPLAFRTVIRVGDEPALLYFVAQGSIFYLADTMSCYRQMSIGSSASRLRNVQTNIEHQQNMIRMIQEFDAYTHQTYHDVCMHNIRRLTFLIEYKKGNYKALFKAEYHPFLREFPVKFRVLQFVRAYAPWALPRKPKKNEQDG